MEEEVCVVAGGGGEEMADWRVKGHLFNTECKVSPGSGGFWLGQPQRLITRVVGISKISTRFLPPILPPTKNSSVSSSSSTLHKLPNRLHFHSLTHHFSSQLLILQLLPNTFRSMYVHAYVHARIISDTIRVVKQ